MGDTICFLITVCNNEKLLNCAVKVKIEIFENKEMVEYPNRYKQDFSLLLPKHVSSFGNVVQVEPLFEVHDISA